MKQDIKNESENISNSISSNLINDFSVIDNKKIALSLKYIGFIIFTLLVSIGIIEFILFLYDGLLTTTYLTLILISFTLIKKFENPHLNSMLTLTFYGFFSFSMWLIPTIDNPLKFFIDFLLHIAIALFQLFLIVSPKIKCSKHAYYWGTLFYMCWLWLYDDLFRLNVIVGVENIFPSIATQIHSFYTLFISLWILIYVKKKRGLLVP